jgi:hypothetical protein
VPRRARRLAGAAWRQPALDAARRARGGRGGGCGGGQARRGAAESRHCCLEGREIDGYLGDGGRIAELGMARGCGLRGKGRGVGKKRAGRGEGATARRARKGFSASRGNARSRTWPLAVWPLGPGGVGRPSKIVGAAARAAPARAVRVTACEL